MLRSTAITGLLAIVLVASCGEPPPDRLADRDAAQAAPPAQRAVVESPGALATRHEAQASFDRARAALVREDLAASARELADAAAFMHTHAEEAELGAIAALQGASKELEVLAQRLARGEPQTTRTLDRVFANANRAETQHHLTRANVAMAKRDYRRAGEELLMAVDHLERASRDLRRQLDADAKAALADARALASGMIRGSAPVRAEARRVTHELEAELRRVCAIIDVEARACAVEAAR